jgi:hypothetical protein
MPRSNKRADDICLLDPYRNNHVWEVIKTLVTGGASASRLLELYYWSREPGVVELIRAYLELPEREQRSLGDYLLNNRPQSIVSAINAQGRLVLSRSDAPTHAQPEKQRQSSRV